MKYDIYHRTIYQYHGQVTLGHNEAHLTPRSGHLQRCLSNKLVVIPTPSIVLNRTDFFGNQATFFSVEEEHRELSITAISEVETSAATHPEPSATIPWEQVRDRLANPSNQTELQESKFTFDSPCLNRDPRLAQYALASFKPSRPILEAAVDLTGRIYREFKYDQTATCVSTPTLEVFEKRHGVCQDFAHLEIACLRSLGLAARYVSGYLLTNPHPGQAKLIGADASHAWLSIYCPGSGWIDLDPTNNQLVDLRHITVAWGRDYNDVCPIKGVFLGGGNHTMEVAVNVTQK